MPATPQSTSHPRTPPAGSAARSRRLVIVPAFNERASVRKVVQQLRRALPGFDVVVIDDGSTDDTVRQVPPGTAVVTPAVQPGHRRGHADRLPLRRPARLRRGRPGGRRRPAPPRRGPAAGGRTGARASRTWSSAPASSGPTATSRSFVRLTGAWFLRGLIRWTDRPGHDRLHQRVPGRQPAGDPGLRPLVSRRTTPSRKSSCCCTGPATGSASWTCGCAAAAAGAAASTSCNGVFYVLKVTVCLLLDLAREPWPRGKVVDHVDDPK